MTNFDESSPFDPDYDGFAIDPERVLGWDGVYQGWDKEQRDRWNNCEGDLEVFVEGVHALRDALDAGRVAVHCDADLVALQLRHETWWRFVDPALSDSEPKGARGPFVTLWECSEHVVALSPNRKGKWVIYFGSQKEVIDLRHTLGLPDEDEHPYEDEVEAPLETLAEDLTPEDLERRKLLGPAERALLEEGSDGTGPKDSMR